MWEQKGSGKADLLFTDATAFLAFYFSEQKITYSSREDPIATTLYFKFAGLSEQRNDKILFIRREEESDWKRFVDIFPVYKQNEPEIRKAYSRFALK
ncbi:hypothetical protein [Kiloniella sp. EL199]|uniref:hypothetical protein n=1 Tax=Kiloniella sp. EL199 TaxID=2107581 RepID=UPI000EA17692|nr:hypothetical protein [Kiloniella sp. EL199]